MTKARDLANIISAGGVLADGVVNISEVVFADNAISGDKVEGGTINAITINTLTSGTVDINGGAVDGTSVGASTPSTGAFTTLSASSTTNLAGLTASTALALDASKNVVSVANTGTGSNVLNTSPTLVTPALGTPSSGVVTNLTGTASININGTVGASTPSTGAFTTLSASGTSTLAAVNSGALAVTGAISSTTGANFATSSGNVGIGLALADTGAKLHVVKDLSGGGDATAFRIQTAATGDRNILFGGASSSGDYSFLQSYKEGTSAGARNFLLNPIGGNVGIGTTSPGAKLQVQATGITFGTAALFLTAGGIASDGLAIGDSGNSAYKSIQSYGGALVLNSVGNYVGIGTTSPGYQLTLSIDSAAKPSTNTWTISSDERIKDNISLANLERCYEIVKSLPLKRFTWKADAYTVEQVADRGKLGWIAQDVQKVFPKSTPISKFQCVPSDDGFEDVQEQVTLDEERITESTAIEVVNGIPTQKTTSKTETIKVPQFDDVAVVDEAGEPVMVPQTDKEIAVVDDAGEPVLDDDGKPMMETVKVADKPLMHQVPRMHTVSKAKMKTEEIEDCLSLNSDQIYAAMYGTIQQLIINSELQQAIIESLTTRITALEGN